LKAIFIRIKRWWSSNKCINGFYSI